MANREGNNLFTVEYWLESDLKMDLYLIRHAKPDGFSGDTSLGDEGKNQAKLLADLFDKLSLPHERVIIISSKYKRALETTKIICEILSVPLDDIKIFPAPIDEMPNANLRERLLKRLKQIKMETTRDAAIIVGHSDYLPEVTTWLTGSQFNFSYGATAYLKVDDSLDQGSGKLQWLIIPELLLKLAIAIRPEDK
ncbi:MAG: hypothetical protein E4G89_03825 [Methanothrix sp.]|nr:MAG: hypothetical protein E4G89_03825 [Methanothrix sp.]